jgi:hypothetical protein
MRTRCGKQTRAGGEHDEEENGLNVKTISSTRTIPYRAVRVSHEDEERTSSFLFSLDRQRVN